MPLLVLFPCCGGQKHLSRRRPPWPAGNGKTGKNSGDDDDMIGFASLRPTATDPQISIIPPLALAPILLLTREGPKHQGTAKRRRSRAASYFPREINYTGYFLEWRRRLPSLARSLGRSVGRGDRIESLRVTMKTSLFSPPPPPSERWMEFLDGSSAVINGATPNLSSHLINYDGRPAERPNALSVSRLPLGRTHAHHVLLLLG